MFMVAVLCWLVFVERELIYQIDCEFSLVCRLPVLTLQPCERSVVIKAEMLFLHFYK